MKAVPLKKKKNATLAKIKRKAYFPQTMCILEQQIWSPLNYLQTNSFTETFTYKININKLIK